MAELPAEAQGSPDRLDLGEYCSVVSQQVDGKARLKSVIGDPPDGSKMPKLLVLPSHWDGVCRGRGCSGESSQSKITWCDRHRASHAGYRALGQEIWVAGLVSRGSNG
jgi:hypothetical protein